MDLHYGHLCRRPTLFRALTRLAVAEFNRMLVDVLPVYTTLHAQQLCRRGHRRARGAGHPFSLDAREQILLTVIWLHLYPAWEALGLLFGVSDTTAGRAIQRVVPALEQAGYGSLRMPDGGRKQRLSLDELLREVPELAAVIRTPAPQPPPPMDWGADNQAPP